MKKGNGFTLIKLLAVIVILAVILVISIPRILDVIDNTKEDSIKSSAKMIINSAEKKNLTNKLNNIDEVITCDNSVKLNNTDYESCNIVLDSDGKATITLVGKGKFEGLKCSGTNDNLLCGELVTLTNPSNMKEYIEKLYNSELSRIENGLKKDNTSDQNIRYYGSNPNNYVLFNNELWRIIGVFGNNVKLVRSETLSSLSWDSSEKSVNGGEGINQWGESTYEDGSTYEGADLQVYLNKMYYGGETVTCYKSYENATKTCPTGSLNDESKTLIDNHTWNTGAIDWETDTLAFYNAERGTNGKICSSGTRCADTVKRTTTWTGYVGLPYITDWAYASSESDCETKIDRLSPYKCKNNNWMNRGSTTWYLSPSSTSTSNANDAWAVRGNGYADYIHAFYSYGFAPAIYLKSDVLISSGNGSESNPYILSNNK